MWTPSLDKRNGKKSHCRKACGMVGIVVSGSEVNFLIERGPSFRHVTVKKPRRAHFPHVTLPHAPALWPEHQVELVYSRSQKLMVLTGFCGAREGPWG